MLFRIASLLIFALALRAGSTASCENLKNLDLHNGTITIAILVPANAFGSSPSFCRVTATLVPSHDSEIKIEVWMPENWNGKLQGKGNGGWTGSISPRVLADGLERGYATAMTNTGHEGDSANFALGHPEKLIDFGYRSTHEMTVAAKLMIRTYYGESPKLAYFSGCSAGGRQGLMEAQRFPEDYDGIVAGSPGLDWSGRAILSIWVAQAVHHDEASYIPPAKYPVIHNAALSACDAEDGLKDGVIEDPMRCRFDPQILECKNGDASDCLTRPQVDAVRKIYRPTPAGQSAARIFPGFEPGSELGWSTMGGPKPFTIGLDLFRYVVFNDLQWDYRKFDFDEDVARTLKASAALNALDPDLKKFAARGGRLIQYHGWNDPQIAPEFSVDYYRSVLATMGEQDTQRFYRLFMVPGMAHCGGGEGTSSFNMIPALEEWVEHKNAPDRVTAARVRDGKLGRTRPLCPFPQIAGYKGSGNPDDASNFTCVSRGATDVHVRGEAGRR
jgi:feruloyl esterase